jgi:Galactosyltransferase
MVRKTMTSHMTNRGQLDHQQSQQAAREHIRNCLLHRKLSFSGVSIIYLSRELCLVVTIMGVNSWKSIALLLACYSVMNNVCRKYVYEKPPPPPPPAPPHHHQQQHPCEDDASTAKNKSPEHYDTNNRYGVAGVLSSSSPGYEYKRMAQRATWGKDAPLYNVKVYFLIDQPDPSLDKEQMLYGDIIYINATYSGRAVRFGEKLYLWYKIAQTLHPDAAFVAKLDDDCVICSNVMWPFVWEHVTPTSYIGWMHKFNKGFNKTNATEARNQIGTWYRMDEFFVVIGKALVGGLARRRYCHNTTTAPCNKETDLFDTNYGGTSLGLWLHAYRDVLNITTLNEISQHPRDQFPMLMPRNRHPLHYTCPQYPYVHYVKDPLAHFPIYNNSAQPLTVQPRSGKKQPAVVE